MAASILPNYGITLMPPYVIIWQTLGCQISMWYKLFDWLRLFSQTAIYPILLREVLIDIYPFVIIMIVILGLFGNCLYIFSSLAVYDGNPQLYSTLLPSQMWSALLNQLIMMTGESDVGNYYLESQLALNIVIWFWFCCAVLMTQIVFMNVLIAIISDTFDRVWEQRQTYIRSSQADIL